MVTMVGNESDIKGLVKDLIYLEHDAIAAYDPASLASTTRSLRARSPASSRITCSTLRY